MRLAFLMTCWLGSLCFAEAVNAQGPYTQAVHVQAPFALTGVTIIDAQRDQPATKQTVLISKGLITAIFPDGSKPLPDSIAVIRLNGKFLLPGLIDTHVHPATDSSGTDNRVATLAVPDRMLHSGITTVRDMAGDARNRRLRYQTVCGSRARIGWIAFPPPGKDPAFPIN